MFEITYTVDGIIQKAVVNASDPYQAEQIFTNMYGSGSIQIINVVRKG